MENKQRVISELERIAKNSYLPGENTVICSVAEISRETGMQPFQIFTLINKGGVSVSEKAVSIQDEKLILRPKPSKRLDKNLSLVRNETQRYQRRFQFPENARPRTTREKAEKITVSDQIKATKIVFGEPEPTQKVNSNLRKQARFFISARKPDKEKLKIEERALFNILQPCGGIGIVQPKQANFLEQSIKESMKKYKYWSQKDTRQQITPDMVYLENFLLTELQEMLALETKMLRNVIGRYIFDIKSGYQSPLVRFLEGNLFNSSVMLEFREWAKIVSPEEAVNYYRPDIGITRDPNNQTRLVYYETNIETAGTAPAVLYRIAQTDFILRYGIKPVSEGSDKFG